MIRRGEEAMDPGPKHTRCRVLQRGSAEQSREMKDTQQGENAGVRS
jgi:hypothetical protein